MRCFVLLQRVQVVEAPEKEQVRDLLDDFEEIGDTTGPESISADVNLAANFAGEHGTMPPQFARTGKARRPLRATAVLVPRSPRRVNRRRALAYSKILQPPLACPALRLEASHHLTQQVN